jgi:site-specific DNA-methyltransferase (adenine-specific)
MSVEWTELDGGRVRLICGDCLDVLPNIAGVHACVTDPPYGLAFMGKRWDYDVPAVAIWEAVLVSMLPGAHLLSFAGTRTQHRMAVNIEDAGFDIRDMIAWVYGSGFPKSLDVSKAIDKAAGAEREVVGDSGTGRKSQTGRDGSATMRLWGNAEGVAPITARAAAAARQWSGWGTAIKPAMEPITVARRPLIGTVAENVLEFGTGGLNVDGCRVGTDDGTRNRPPSKPCNTYAQDAWTLNPDNRKPFEAEGLGRWPANLIHDGSEEVVGLFPEKDGTVGACHDPNGSLGYMGGASGRFVAGTRDSGSAARFFYCAKASKADRDEGLDSSRTVKYDVPKGASSCKDVSTVLVALLQRAICESTLRWHIAESGESIMGRCQLDSLSTIATAISRTTESKILSLLTHSLISDCIADASCATANGGSRAGNADSSSALQPTTTSESLAALARGVRLVVSPMLSVISDAANWKPSTNIHSTVKPTALMRYLCRLVTPPGGIVLDPFMGSGSTGKAAVLEGFRFIGIERDPGYFEIAKRRIQAAIDKRDAALPFGASE